MNSEFSSIKELNVDKCLDSSKSYTCSVKFDELNMDVTKNLLNSSNVSLVKISCCTVAAVMQNYIYAKTYLCRLYDQSLMQCDSSGNLV